MTPEQLSTSAREFYVYLHSKPDGSPFYVGKGFGNRSHRFTGRSKHHQNVVEKYGIKNIGVFVFPCNSETDAFADEMLHINQLRLDGYKLVNQTNGGEGESGRWFSPETRAKMSASLKGKNKGRKLSQETIAKIIAKTTGKKRSDEVKKVLSTKKLGNQNALGHKGGNTSGLNFLGKHHSQESKDMISATKKGRPWTDARRMAAAKKQTGGNLCL